MSSEQVCQGGETLIFACSGAADVGAISYQAARKLTKEGVGKMFCLAGVGGRVAPIVEKTKAAVKILAIDGCGLDCVKSTLDQAGITNYQQLRVTDLGLTKGHCPVTAENVEVIVTQSKAMLNN
ncbi:putative zinc-binding protein [Planctomycetota bacterium]